MIGKVSVRFLLAGAVLGLLASCSLLKISADFGMEPLPRKDLNARLQVRLYASNFTEAVAAAADTVFARSQDAAVRLNSIRWKQNATAACMIASLSQVPAAALVNTWVVVKGMDELLGRENFFGNYGSVARQASEHLLDKYRTLARGLMPPGEYTAMERFVDSVLRAEPLTPDYMVKDYTYAWYKYTGVPDSLIVRTVGSIAEVIADLNDRVSKYTFNVTNQLEWTRDRIGLQLSEKLADSVYTARLDSLNHTMGVLKVALRDAPRAADSLTGRIMSDLNSLLYRTDRTVNRTVENTIRQIDSQRIGLQKFVAQERSAILGESRNLIRQTLSDASEQVSELIGKVLIYILIFVLLLLGIPFYIGYRIGRSRGSKSMGKE